MAKQPETSEKIKNNTFNSLFRAIFIFLKNNIFRSTQKDKTHSYELPLTIETITGNATRINVKARKNKERIYVSGNISKKPGFIVPHSSHLHIVGIDSTGKKVVEELIPCSLKELSNTPGKLGSRLVWYKSSFLLNHPTLSE